MFVFCSDPAYQTGVTTPRASGTLRVMHARIGCDTFLTDQDERVCLIRRADNALWALPGGYLKCGETPAQCARREFEEETGLVIRVTGLLGVFSSLRYDDATNVNRGREVAHLLFAGEVIGGMEKPSSETGEVGWFSCRSLPELSNGQAARIGVGAQKLSRPHFE